MKQYLETTRDLYPHTYLLDDSKRTCFGYIKQGTTEIKMFGKPLRFDPKGRTFKEVKSK
jgi:hypothetical protein